MSTQTYTIYHAAGRTTVKAIVIFRQLMQMPVFLKDTANNKSANQE
jgi:hypothetical protein